MTPWEALEVIKKLYTDQWGHIVQWDKDKGDTANREGVVAFLVKIQGLEDWSDRFNKVLNQLEFTPGIYRRHGFPQPGDQDYVGDIERFSRDQQTPLEVAMGEYPEQRFRLLKLYMNHACRCYKYQNKDWWIGTYGRSLGYEKRNLRPLFEDMALVINSLFACTRRIKDIFTKEPDTSNDVNHALLIIQASRKKSTWLSWIATKIYKISNPQKALDQYFSEKSGAPPISVLYREPLRIALNDGKI